jgi:hypothetical protein
VLVAEGFQAIFRTKTCSVPFKLRRTQFGLMKSQLSEPSIGIIIAEYPAIAGPWPKVVHCQLIFR